MPIELIVTTAEERAKEHADRLAMAARTTIVRGHLPTGGQFAVEHTPAGYLMSGDLALFGVERFGEVPITEAVDEADAVRLADEMVRRRWVRECCEGVCRAEVNATTTGAE